MHKLTNGLKYEENIALTVVKQHQGTLESMKGHLHPGETEGGWSLSSVEVNRLKN